MEGKLHIMMVISMMLPFAKLAFAMPDTLTLGVSRLFLFWGGRLHLDYSFFPRSH